MKKRYRNYFCGVALILLVYLFGLTVVRIQEEYFKQSIEGLQVSQQFIWTQVVVFFEGAAIAGLAGYWFICQKKEKQEIKENEEFNPEVLSQEGVDQKQEEKLPLTKQKWFPEATKVIGIACVFGLCLALVTPPVSQQLFERTSVLYKVPEKQEPISEAPKETKPAQDSLALVPIEEDNLSDQALATNSVEGSDVMDKENLTSSESTRSALAVEINSSLDFTNGTIKKTGGDADAQSASKYGLNSTLLVKTSGMANVSDSILESTPGASPVAVSSGKKSRLNVYNSKLMSYGNVSSAALAVMKGSVSVYDSSLFTKGEFSPALKSADEATLYGQNLLIETSGIQSPIISASSALQVDQLDANAKASNAVYIEDGAAVEIINSTISCSAHGVNDLNGLFAFSGKEPVTPSKESTQQEQEKEPFSLKVVNSSVVYNPDTDMKSIAPAFNLSNVKGSIYCADNAISSQGADLFRLQKSDLNLTLENQTFYGIFKMDDQSTLNLTLKKDSLLTARLADQADSKAQVNLVLEPGSQLTLLADCYVKSADIQEGALLNTNGYTLYVDGVPFGGS